jgi:hypothetical protein
MWKNLKRKMYRVKYYMSGQTLVSKYFETLHNAVMFSVYQVTSGNVYSIDKVEA